MLNEPSGANQPDNMIQLTLYCRPTSTIETIAGRVQWDTYLNDCMASLKRHGRQAEIRSREVSKITDYKSGEPRRIIEMALFVNQVAPTG